MGPKASKKAPRKKMLPSLSKKKPASGLPLKRPGFSESWRTLRRIRCAIRSTSPAVINPRKSAARILQLQLTTTQIAGDFCQWGFIKNYRISDCDILVLTESYVGRGWGQLREGVPEHAGLLRMLPGLPNCLQVGQQWSR